MRIIRFTVRDSYDQVLLYEEEFEAEHGLDAALEAETKRVDAMASAELRSLEQIILVPADAIRRVDVLGRLEARLAAEAMERAAEERARVEAARATLSDEARASYEEEIRGANAGKALAEGQLARAQMLAKNWEASCMKHGAEVLELRKRLRNLEERAEAGDEDD